MGLLASPIDLDRHWRRLLNRNVSQTQGFMDPTESTDGNVSSSECRGCP